MKKRMSHLQPAMLLTLVLLTTACSKVGIDPDASDALSRGVAVAQAEWVVLDLRNGQASGFRTLQDVTTNPTYRDSHMVFRRLRSGTATIGAHPDDTWAQDDEPRGDVVVQESFIAAFEVTRAQWRRIAGDEPWTLVQPAELVGSGDELPACGFSFTNLRARLAASSLRLALPSDAEWERACAAGSTARFAWGDAYDEATVRRFAVVRQTATADGPQAPGSREANAFGLHDFHGNLWEFTSSGRLRGGSWSDGLPMARSANVLEIDPDTAYGLAGARLVYRP